MSTCVGRVKRWPNASIKSLTRALCQWAYHPLLFITYLMHGCISLALSIPHAVVDHCCRMSCPVCIHHSSLLSHVVSCAYLTHCWLSLYRVLWPRGCMWHWVHITSTVAIVARLWLVWLQGRMWLARRYMALVAGLGGYSRSAANDATCHILRFACPCPLSFTFMWLRSFGTYETKNDGCGKTNEYPNLSSWCFDVGPLLAWFWCNDYVSFDVGLDSFDVVYVVVKNTRPLSIWNDSLLSCKRYV